MSSSSSSSSSSLSLSLSLSISLSRLSITNDIERHLRVVRLGAEVRRAAILCDDIAGDGIRAAGVAEVDAHAVIPDLVARDGERRDALRRYPDAFSHIIADLDAREREAPAIHRDTVTLVIRVVDPPDPGVEDRTPADGEGECKEGKRGGRKRRSE